MYAINYDSPIGKLTIAAADDKIVGLWRLGQKYYGGGILKNAVEREDTVLKAARQWLDAYFGGRKPVIAELPLSPAGSLFRREVWRLLCQIPYGKVVTYGELAEQMAKIRNLPRMSAQAVGGAVGHNPISIIIPCHRVVGSNGSLTGYAGGIAAKSALLAIEGADLSKLWPPNKGTAL